MSQKILADRGSLEGIRSTIRKFGVDEKFVDPFALAYATGYLGNMATPKAGMLSDIANGLGSEQSWARELVNQGIIRHMPGVKEAVHASLLFGKSGSARGAHDGVDEAVFTAGKRLHDMIRNASVGGDPYD
ncbi:MAG: hypothetical protein KGH98_01740 [Candidatus Micrarchaeota archaeon]|nr:hypothetical protein [Candidatus Micrarchaeota archaeon]